MITAAAFYLKYRPQALSELVGQEAVKKNLVSSFQNNKLSHAYLFVGPRGTGKTSTARILAKMVNCEESSSVIPANPDLVGAKAGIYTKKLSDGFPNRSGMTEGIPCNICDTCMSITNGSNLDLIEIDAASNRGIEDIRSLREKIKLAPTAAKKKVYIIDEVHMLTTEAFNALLKTLEEPPQHVLFILATTEGGKIPQTILSRVQKLDFKLASANELLEALGKIIKAEKIDIEEEALKILAQKAEGSFRDGVKLLNQLSSSGEKITTAVVADNLNSSMFEDTVTILQAIQNQDAAKALLDITKQLEAGVSPKEQILSLMDGLRNLILIKNGLGEQLVKIRLLEEQYQVLIKVSGNFSTQNLANNLDILQNALEKLKFASIPSLPLELAVVEICDFSVIATPSIQNRRGKQYSSVNNPTQIASLSFDELRTPRNDKKETIDNGKLKIVVESSRIEDREEINPLSGSDSPDILKLKEKWAFVLETIRAVNFSLEALLRGSSVVQCNDKTVVIEVPYTFHQRILETPKNRSLIEGIFSDILGRSIRISIMLGARPSRKEDIANIEVAKDDEIIRAAAEIFNSDLVN